MAVSPRSQARADAAPLTDEEIDRLVETFYARIRQHHRLGPIFEAAVGPGGWPEHLAKLKDFWSSVLNTSGRYKGQPVAAHHSVEGITEGLFTPWLGLFHMTCAELFDAPGRRSSVRRPSASPPSPTAHREAETAKAHRG